MADEVRDRLSEMYVGRVFEEQIQKPEQGIDQRREHRAQVAEPRLRPGRTQRRNEEQYAGDHQATAASEEVRQDAAKGAADETTPQRARDREPFEAEPRAFGEPQRRNEILLDCIGRAGDDGGVVAEQEATESGDDREGD
jgi:hypothetical protein